MSPVGFPANVLYQIGLDTGLPGFLKLGTWTVGVYCLYVLAQILTLGKDFKPVQLLQLALSFLFGMLVNLTTAMVSVLPDPASYGMRMLYLLINVPLVATGVMLYLSPDLISTPGEGMSLAISKRWNISVPLAITIFDCSMVIVSVIISLIHFHSLVGVREGTVICALFTGFVMRQLQKIIVAIGREFGAGGSGYSFGEGPENGGASVQGDPL